MEDKKQQLFDRLEKNLSDYHELIAGFDPKEIIEMADRVAAYGDAYFYLTEHHGFMASEIDYLLNFEKPLEVVADEWQRRRDDISDMSFALNHVFDKRDALQGGYRLMPGAPARDDGEHGQSQPPSSVSEKKPSIMEQLESVHTKIASTHIAKYINPQNKSSSLS